MRLYREVIDYCDFEFWAGAKDTVKYLKAPEIASIFAQLEEIYPDGMSETELNDLFWFDDDFIAGMIGYDNFEQIMDERSTK